MIESWEDPEVDGKTSFKTLEYRSEFVEPNYCVLRKIKGARGCVVVKALCCKPEGRGFESR
jgi:hypothetical protein